MTANRHGRLWSPAASCPFWKGPALAAAGCNGREAEVIYREGRAPSCNRNVEAGIHTCMAPQRLATPRGMFATRSDESVTAHQAYLSPPAAPG